MRSRVLGGAAWVLKNSPSFFPFSSLSGGYQEMSAGLPSKKSRNHVSQCIQISQLICVPSVEIGAAGRPIAHSLHSKSEAIPALEFRVHVGKSLQQVTYQA